MERLQAGGDLKIVLTALQQEYIQVLVSTAPEDAAIREECYVKHMTLADLQTLVENYGKKA